MRSQPLPSSVAVHHNKCQTADEAVREMLHLIYQAFDGPITKVGSVITHDELIPARCPERPGFRNYSE